MLVLVILPVHLLLLAVHHLLPVVHHHHLLLLPLPAVLLQVLQAVDQMILIQMVIVSVILVITVA